MPCTALVLRSSSRRPSTSGVRRSVAPRQPASPVSPIDLLVNVLAYCAATPTTVSPPRCPVDFIGISLVAASPRDPTASSILVFTPLQLLGSPPASHRRPADSLAALGFGSPTRLELPSAPKSGDCDAFDARD